MLTNPTVLTLKDCETGLKPFQNGQVSYQVFEQKIVVQFTFDEAYPHPKHTDYNAPLYDGDIAEILLTLGKKNRYLEIEVNENSALYVAIITNKDGEGDFVVDFLDEHEVTYSTTLKDNIWSTTIELPICWLKSLGYQNNEFWNLLREDYDDEGNMHLSCISPTYCRSFHKIKAFVPINKGE